MPRVVTEMSQTARGAVSRTHQASRALAVDGDSGGPLNEVEVVPVVNHGERERGEEGRHAREDHDGSNNAQGVEDALKQFDRFRHALRGVGDDAHLPIEPERRARNTPKMWQTASSNTAPLLRARTPTSSCGTMRTRPVLRGERMGRDVRQQRATGSRGRRCPVVRPGRVSHSLCRASSQGPASLSTHHGGSEARRGPDPGGLRSRCQRPLWTPRQAGVVMSPTRPQG